MPSTPAAAREPELRAQQVAGSSSPSASGSAMPTLPQSAGQVGQPRPVAAQQPGQQQVAVQRAGQSGADDLQPDANDVEPEGADVIMQDQMV
eukprot:15472475-Alexandrium_andersonii.AAC.1